MTSPFSPEIKRTFEDSAKERISYVRNLPRNAHIHISGVCGTGTGSVLSLLKKLGFYVTGSDKAFYPPMGDVVKKTADKVYEGYSVDNLVPRPDLVVIGNALSRGNPEVEYIIEQGIPFTSMPEVFSALLIGDRNECAYSVVVSGTHGKTTTTSLIASILEEAGKKPGYFIGGVPTGAVLKGSIELPSSEIPPSDRVVVLEGDEYDSAFFAKYSKFHCYRPDIVVITNIEFDHGDIFEDIDAIKNEFRQLIERLPDDGVVVVCRDAHIAFELVQEVSKTKENLRVVSYGRDKSSDVVLRSRETVPIMEGQGKVPGQKLTISFFEDEINFQVPISGEHNALNIAAASIVCAELGVTMSQIADTLRTFSSIKRRQQVIAEKNGIVLIEDFAHHPTEVRVTLEGLRDAYPDKRLIAVFEPRSNTSRRAFFRDEYKNSLSVADIIVLKDMDNATSQVYSGVSSAKPLFEIQELASLLKNENKEVFASKEIESLFSYIVQTQKSGDLIVVMSNGDFGGIVRMIEAALP